MLRRGGHALVMVAEGVEMLTLTGPFLAEPAKAWLLHRRGIETPAAFGAVAAEYLLYNLTAAWLGSVALGILLSRGALLHALNAPAEGLLAGVAALTIGCAVTAVTGRGLVASSVQAIARRVAPRRAAAAVARGCPGASGPRSSSKGPSNGLARCSSSFQGRSAYRRASTRSCCRRSGSRRRRA